MMPPHACSKQPPRLPVQHGLLLHRENLRHEPSVRNGEHGERKRIGETTRSACTGIEEKTGTAPLEFRPVAVPEDEEARTPYPGRLHILSTVNHPKRKAGQLSMQTRRQLLGLWPGVGIPAHGIDRCDLPEPGEDLRASHVSGVENPIAPYEELQDPRSQEPVGI